MASNVSSTLGCNFYIPTYVCTLETCCVEYQGIISYLPSIPANAFFLGAFALLLLVQIGFGIRYHMWGFAAGMFCGLVLEVIGYAGRIRMHSNPFLLRFFCCKLSYLFVPGPIQLKTQRVNWSRYLIGLTIGPVFMAASIYLYLARIVTVYGTHLSRFKPRTYTITFMSCDFVSLVLQAIGGGFAANATDNTTENLGVHIMIAGLACQVFSLLLFMVLCTEFAWRVHRSPTEKNDNFSTLRTSFKFRGFQFALALATFTIFVRSVFRVAELQGGFSGSIANNETVFIILEGPMVMVAVISLTVFYPGFCFGDSWNAANWSLRKR